MSERDYKKYVIRTLEGWNQHFNCKLRVDETNGEEIPCTLLHLMNDYKYCCTTTTWHDMFLRIDLIRVGMEIMLDHHFLTH